MMGRSIAVVASLLLAGATARGAKIDWPTYGGGVQRTGENAAESALGPSTVGGLAQRWATDRGGVIVASPVLAADVAVGGVATDLLYVGTEHGLLAALDAATGRIVWSRNLGTQSTACDDSPDGVFGVTDTPALDRASQTLYVAGGDGRLYALDWATGATRSGWPVTVTTDPAHEHVWGAVTLANGKLYVETASFCDATPYYGRVTQIDPATRATSSWYVTAAPSTGPGGGGIWGWGGASVDATGDLYVATGNATTTPESYGYAERVVRLTSALAVRSSNYPGLTGFDVDFGTTPVPVQAPGCPAQLAVENKSGVLFLYDRDTITSGPVQSIAVADYVDGGELIGVPAYRAATQTVYVSNPTDRTGAVFRHGLLAFTLGTDCLLHLAWQHAMGLNGAVATASPLARCRAVISTL